jgi:outer membrane protein OmpA-like peptidoglycan-associated protein
MQPFYNLYAVPLDGDMKEAVTPRGDFGQAEGKVSLNDKTGKSLPDGINKRYHDGPIRVASSGNILFFTSNYSEVKRPKAYAHRITLMIYYSEKKDGVWSEPKGIPSNSFEYSNQHAYYDEGTSSLYFASNRPGGKGGYDIWKSVRKSDGSWSEAENLGDKVNTSKAEVFPSLTPDGQLLFASNGWPGLGGLDMFMSEGNSKEPLNLLAGINSEKDDFGLYFTDRNSGYLGSNRDGSVGDDDIWSFTMEWDVKTVRKYNTPEVPVNIVAKDAGTKQPIGVQLKIRQEGSSDRTVAAGSEGSTINLTAGDEITFTADGYEPMMVKVTEALLDQRKLEPEMKAVVVPDPVFTIKATDGETGSSITPEVKLNRNGVITAVGAAQGYTYKAGDRLTLTLSGYSPVEMEVSDEMITSGKIGSTMVRERTGVTPIAVSTTDGKGALILPVQVNVNRVGKSNAAGISYTTSLFNAGDELSLAEGDELLIGSEGFAPARIKVTRSMIRSKKILVNLKGLNIKNEIAASSYGPIYYAYRKWDLSASAQVILNKLVNDMNANPQLKVELRAHADCRGIMESNMRLSEQRLESAIRYVQSRITNPERITGRGLGESVLVNDCACEGTVRSTCRTAEHGLNRRTEFVIIAR